MSKFRAPLAGMSAAQERRAIEAALVEAWDRISGRSGAAAKRGIPHSSRDSKIKALKDQESPFKTA